MLDGLLSRFRKQKSPESNVESEIDRMLRTSSYVQLFNSYNIFTVTPDGEAVRNTVRKGSNDGETHNASLPRLVWTCEEYGKKDPDFRALLESALKESDFKTVNQVAGWTVIYSLFMQEAEHGLLAGHVTPAEVHDLKSQALSTGMHLSYQKLVQLIKERAPLWPRDSNN